MIYIYNEDILKSKKLPNSNNAGTVSLNKFIKAFKVVGNIILGVTAPILLIGTIFIWFY